ncbi:uncharacterized protein VICG_01045 [Vittaforma corneae ATCC 50505]|uniref:Uncharacterized protein n=1 Tax=Vittaforma corneae (strain ATCC 50505) TaxID=993615 RepID=L2GLY8_VITCO|nr:uncharacterized protein VICG_01045 [Vittaforma corneae ATCC 50505]ELA41861.1 hypothetical protein VICG_01045 [Vittaforma corneae ATCC 50505]
MKYAKTLMIISRRENITKNIMSDEIYELLIDELNNMCLGNQRLKDKDQVESHPQQNPFVERSSSQESIDTFVPVGSLKAHVKEKAQAVFGSMPTVELNRLITTIVQIKNKSFGKMTRFCCNTEQFFTFLKTFFEKQNPTISPIENLIQILELEKNREIIEPLAIKYFKVVFYFQKPLSPSYYELSIVYNMMKIDFKEDQYIKSVVNVILREFILNLVKKYVSNTRAKLTNAQVKEFSGIIEITINAFNGIIVELDVEPAEISRIIYVMLCFYLNRYKSEFHKNYGIRELFYCAVRTVYQGHQFAKRLECFIASKLKWKLKTEDQEFTCDKIYQTLFKHEYKKTVGKIRHRNISYMKYSNGLSGASSNSSSSDENQRVLITKIVQTTPKMNKSQEKYAFSPLSRRIGESLQSKENLDSKRKLKFEE